MIRQNERNATLGLFVFFAALMPLSILGYYLWFIEHNHFALIFAPAAASIVARIVRREGFRDVSFRFGGVKTLRAIVLTLLFPLVIGTVAYGLAWSLGMAHWWLFPIPHPFPNPLSALPHFTLLIALALTVITGFYVPLAAGEEIGWRGYMLTRLISTRIRAPLLMSGLVWGGWHLPLILGGAYKPGEGPNVLFAATVFIVTAVGFSYFLAWLRLSTGSIWPCIIAHASWNAVIGVAFDGSTRGVEARWWIGESGILVAAMVAASVAILWRIKKITVPLGAMRKSGV